MPRTATANANSPSTNQNHCNGSDSTATRELERLLVHTRSVGEQLSLFAQPCLNQGSGAKKESWGIREGHTQRNQLNTCRNTGGPKLAVCQWNNAMVEFYVSLFPIQVWTTTNHCVQIILQETVPRFHTKRCPLWTFVSSEVLLRCTCSNLVGRQSSALLPCSEQSSWDQ